MVDAAQSEIARLEREGTETLSLAGSYARNLETLARRMRTIAIVGPLQDTTALRSAALRLSHAANEAMAALVSVIVQSARLDALATMRPTQESKGTEPGNR